MNLNIKTANPEPQKSQAVRSHRLRCGTGSCWMKGVFFFSPFFFLLGGGGGACWMKGLSFSFST